VQNFITNGATGKAACIGSAARKAPSSSSDSALAPAGRRWPGTRMAELGRRARCRILMCQGTVLITPSKCRCGRVGAALVSRRLLAQRQGRRLHHSNSILGHPSQAVTSRHRYRTRVQSNGPWSIGPPVSFTVTE
jgi:hypothetical protein